MMIRLLLITLIGLLTLPAGAQQKSQPANTVAIVNTNTGKVYYGGRNEAPRAFEFNSGTVAAATFLANINQYLNIPYEFTFREKESNTDNLGMKHRLLQQYHRGILIEGALYRTHEKKGFIVSANGRAVRNIQADTEFILSEQQAYQIARNHLHSVDPIAPQGRAMIVSKDFTFAAESFSVAYQFDLNVSFIEQWRVSIDARTGVVVNKVSLVNSCRNEPELPLPYSTGDGTTNYYGKQTIRVEKDGSGTYSMLRGETAHGGKIGTYDFRNASMIMLQMLFQYHSAYLFSSPTNTYHSDYQKPAVSAQWAAEQAYEYFFVQHGRNSFDNNGSEIKCYVHVDEKLDNAFWIRNLLAIGDGSNNNPLVELDIIGHELTHGVTQYEAGLQYSYESGALNESFSDIFGKAIEFDRFGDTATWQVARRYRNGGLRDMGNPNLRQQPDTYGGDLWYTGYDDSGGVHYNSGVQNYWFYLLCEGGSGTNDLAMPYSVNPIGMDAATRIAYRSLTEYLSPLSDYLDARIGSMLAASDLFGSNSNQYREVDKAWDAVGVIDEPGITGINVFDITATTVRINGSLIPRSSSTTYRFEYGTTPALGNATAEIQYVDKVEGALTGLQSSTKYYLKIIASNEHGSMSRSSEFTTISPAPMALIKETVDVTETTATLYGSINPNSLATSFHFEYGLTPALGMVTTASVLPGATEFNNVSADITGLLPKRKYYYRLVATNSFAAVTTTTVSFFTAVKPTINSFSPLTGIVGSEVTIVGRNFNPEPAQNKVSFGATLATVTSATTSQIIAKVPPGASLGTLSLLDGESGLTAQSTQEFVPTFTTTFNKRDINLVVGTNDSYASRIFIEDIDRDGKPDIVTSQSGGFSVFQNVNQGGDITSESFVRDTHNSTGFYGLYLADMDGNGLKDIVGGFDDHIRIFPNQSVPGYVFFGVPVDVPLPYLADMVLDDFDMDGHIDIAGIEYSPTKLAIIRNQNPKGSLAPGNFALYRVMPISHNVNVLVASDVNNDGAPDLLISDVDHDGGANIPVLTNKSRPGAFDFEETLISDPSRSLSTEYLSHDMNVDGAKDLIGYYDNAPSNLSILQNTRTPNDVSFSAPVTALSGYQEYSVKAGDIDGDGKPDLVAGIPKREFLLLKNKTANGANLSAASFENFATYGLTVSGSGTVESKLFINDLNGDGRPDIIKTNSYSYWPRDGYDFEIWQNQTPNCPDPAGVTISVAGYSATLSLPPDMSMDDYEIDFRSTTYSSWSRLDSPIINYLGYSRQYELRIRAKCYLGYTGYHYIEFTTDCVNTSDFSIALVGADYVQVRAYNLSDIEVQCSVAGADTWTTLPQNESKFQYLKPGTTYDLRYRGYCTQAAAYTYKQFTTLCAELQTLSVNDISFNRAVVNWTTAYNADATIEYSVDNIDWNKVDNSKVLFPLTPATTYYVRGKVSCTGAPSTYLYSLFTTPCPSVASLTFEAVTPFTARITWIDPATTGDYTVTYSESLSGKTITARTSLTYLDLDALTPGMLYAVTVTPTCTASAITTSGTFTTVCYAPTDLAARNITYTNAELTWNDPVGGLPFTIDYRIATSTSWTSMSTSTTRLDIKDLRPGTRYEVKAHIECPSVPEPFAWAFFETALYDETSLFPNPTDGQVTIYPSKNLIGNRFGIYDSTGKVWMSGELRSYTFDLTELARGAYTLVIDGENPMRIIKY